MLVELVELASSELVSFGLPSGFVGSVERIDRVGRWESVASRRRS